MKEESDGEDKRRHPRLYLDLPIEYRFTDLPSAHGGIVVNGSETGFLIYSLKDMPVGTNLRITVLFPKGFQLANFEVSGKIVWKDIFSEEDWEGYKYGLHFTQIAEEDRQKLTQLFSASNLDSSQPLEALHPNRVWR